ncbi:DUF2946 family protein [Salipiger bermudensis]|uniref:DUF2946 family protein n=1 Tax=Salipiger bermudensis TaxID=344736 RepID=UPI001CD5960A|nr:DUF2946 family protein [Salipiger bermudensis]MCA0963264.1 hypothetical protein [Salipiger bermudensis]
MRERASLSVGLSLGVLLALSSVFSAMLMSPERASAGYEAYALVYGDDPADLCGDHSEHDGHAGHDHHCPLCHGLPDAPESARPERHTLLEPHEAWQRRDDLHRNAQARNLRHSTRAPPVSV